jgi:MFS family permease
MIIGRILNGFCGGILTTCTAMSIVETTPSKYLGVMGSMTNFFIALGIMSITNVGLILPQDYKDKELMKADERWHYVAAVSPVVSLIQLILLLIFVRQEPI